MFLLKGFVPAMSIMAVSDCFCAIFGACDKKHQKDNCKNRKITGWMFMGNLLILDCVRFLSYII